MANRALQYWVSCFAKLRQVAVVADAVVAGCIDIRLPRAAAGVHPNGVPAQDAAGAYVLNVVVHQAYRGQRLGRALMLEAMSRAAGPWKAATLYTHVDEDNVVAYNLYRACGFQDCDEDVPHIVKNPVGKLFFLKASTADLGT